MFSLPQGGKSDEGTSDETAVVLLGDTVSEFKHFLWSLYALQVLSLVWTILVPNQD